MRGFDFTATAGIVAGAGNAVISMESSKKIYYVIFVSKFES